jgi:hypothetical protein
VHTLISNVCFMFLNPYLKSSFGLTNVTFPTRARDFVDTFPQSMVNRVFYRPHSLFDSSHGIERSHNLFSFQDPCNLIRDPMDVGKESLHVGGLLIVRMSPSFFLFHFLHDVFLVIAYAFKNLG